MLSYVGSCPLDALQYCSLVRSWVSNGVVFPSTVILCCSSSTNANTIRVLAPMVSLFLSFCSVSSGSVFSTAASVQLVGKTQKLLKLPVSVVDQSGVLLLSRGLQVPALLHGSCVARLGTARCCSHLESSRH